MAKPAYGADANAEVPQLGMQTLWRLAIWGGLATFALLAAVISAYSNAGTSRQTPSIIPDQAPAIVQHAPAEEIAPRPAEPPEETRRLAEAVRSLAADHDQLLTRIAALERNLDGVTGTIRRDRAAIPPAIQPQNPFAATNAAPVPRPETPAVPVTEAAAVNPPPPSQQPGPADATQMAAPDAGSHAAAPASNLARVPTPAEPLAAAAGLGVDIGGAINYEGLRTLWRSTKNSDPAALGDLSPLVAVRENGKTHGVDLRLVVGPVADPEAAARLCMTLAATHHYCQPVAFEGQRLSQIDPLTAKSAPVAPHIRAVGGK
jgi:hypothetical protein